MLSLMTDWAGEFPEHPSQKIMPSTGPVYAQILTLYKSLLPYIYTYSHCIGKFFVPRNHINQEGAESVMSCGKKWHRQADIYICIHIYGSASASPPNGDGCSVLLLMGPFPCGLWWWGVWDVGDGWPGLLLMVPPLPPCGLWLWGVCMFVCLYV